MEGFLQSLKHKNPDMQREICSYVGIKAKRAGGTHWMRHQKLYWKGVAHMLQTAKGQIPSDEFAQGFLQGIHYMEVLHEIRVMETPDPPKHSKVGPVAPEKKSPLGPPPPPPIDGL